VLGSGLGGEGFTTGQAVVRPFVGADYTNGITRGGNITYILRLQTFGSRSGQAYDPLGRLTDADYRSASDLLFALTAGSTGESYEYAYDARRPFRSHGNRLTYSGPDGNHTYQVVVLR